MASYDTPIVVCDDDAPLVDLLCEFLREYGYEPVGVHRAAELMPLVRDRGVEIVLLDLNLPDGSGLDLLRRIKEEERRLGRVVRVIVLTARNDAPTAMDALRAGAFYFFTKPVIFKSVIEQIEIAVEEILKERAKLAEVHAAGVTEPADALDQVLAAKEQPSLAAIRFPFDRLAVLRSAPEGPGVITLRDRDERAVWVEWCDGIARRLTYFIALNPALSEQCRYAHTFEYFLTDDRKLEGTIFDKHVNELGAFPRCMRDAPEGSKYAGKTEASVGAAADGVVTQMVSGAESTRALEDVRRMLAASPDDVNLKDWYAFLCYSHGLYDEAIAAYEQLVAAGSIKAEHHFYLANAWYKKGDPRRAVEHWRRVVSSIPEKKLGKKAALRIKKALAELGG